MSKFRQHLTVVISDDKKLSGLEVSTQMHIDPIAYQVINELLEGSKNHLLDPQTEESLLQQVETKLIELEQTGNVLVINKLNHTSGCISERWLDKEFPVAKLF